MKLKTDIHVGIANIEEVKSSKFTLAGKMYIYFREQIRKRTIFKERKGKNNRFIYKIKLTYPIPLQRKIYNNTYLSILNIIFPLIDSKQKEKQHMGQLTWHNCKHTRQIIIVFILCLSWRLWRSYINRLTWSISYCLIR